MQDLPKLPSKWITKKTTEVYETPWIKVTDHQIIDPGGNDGQYGVIEFKNFAIGIVPLDEDNNTWLVGQYRYPVDAYSWEIPAGGGKRGIDPVESAQRELREETGIIAKKWDKVLDIDLSNSASTEIAHIYLARDLTFTEAQPDADEDLQIVKMPFKELYQRVMNGEIRDSLTVMAAMKVKLLLNN